MNEELNANNKKIKIYNSSQNLISNKNEGFLKFN